MPECILRSLENGILSPLLQTFHKGKSVKSQPVVCPEAIFASLASDPGELNAVFHYVKSKYTWIRYTCQEQSTRRERKRKGEIKIAGNKLYPVAAMLSLEKEL